MIQTRKVFSLLWASGIALYSVLFTGAAGQSRLPAGRVVFVGDSITYSGQYIEYLETALRLLPSPPQCEFINVGLPSETVSGLSEPGHAGGAFPRPDLHERLERVLQQTKPAVVVACYGMNDGIYYPLGAERFQKFQDGMRWLHERVTQTGARIIHATPSMFDPLPIQARTLPAGRAEYSQPYEGYDEVLGAYSQWLLAQRASGWEVVDIHGPMNQFVTEQRRRVPAFSLAGDGVHPNAVGQWLMARPLLFYLAGTVDWASSDDPQVVFRQRPHGLELLSLIQQRQRLLKDAWLTSIGHRRPGMGTGLPLTEAQAQAALLDARIAAMLAPLPTPEILRGADGLIRLSCPATNVTVPP